MDIATPLIERPVDIRFVEDAPDVTSGSLLDLPDDYPGTANWRPQTETSPHLRDELTGYYHITTTGTVSAYDILVYELTTYYIQVDYQMLQLESAAKLGDERAFLAAQKMIDWQRRQPEDFISAVQLALSAGAYLAARRLSAKGAERYPNHAELQKYARILAPPKVTRSNRPPDPTLRANRDWLMTHSDSFQGQWVALRNGKLLGSATSLEALVAQIGDTKGILLTKVY